MLDAVFEIEKKLASTQSANTLFINTAECAVPTRTHHVCVRVYSSIQVPNCTPSAPLLRTELLAVVFEIPSRASRVFSCHLCTQTRPDISKMPSPAVAISTALLLLLLLQLSGGVIKMPFHSVYLTEIEKMHARNLFTTSAPSIKPSSKEEGRFLIWSLAGLCGPTSATEAQTEQNRPQRITGDDD